MPASPEGREPRPWLVTVLALAIAAEGIVAVRAGFQAFLFQSAVLSLASGWVTAAAGLTAWLRAPTSRVGPLLVAAGAAVFLPAFETAIGGPGSQRLTLLAAAIVAQALLTAPGGRAADQRGSLLIGVLYVVAIVNPADGLGLALALLAALWLGRRWWSRDPHRGAADLAGLLLAAGLAIGPLLALIGATRMANPVAVFAASLGVAAILTASAAIRAGAMPARLTDLVLRLDPAAPTSITVELRRLVGDPRLEVAYPLPGGGHADASGRRLVLPAGDDRRTVTELGDGSGILIVHDRRLDADRGMRAAIARAVALTSANVRLLGELRAQATEVRASRVRLLEAEAAERGAIGERLHTRLEPVLDALAGDLDAEAGERVRLLLEEIRGELRTLADGLRPRALASGGLDGALAALAARSAVPVALDVAPLPPLPPAIEAAGWFVCNEALANVAKHAPGARTRIHAAVADGWLAIEITDDGPGGAHPDRGTGLRGMQDRVEAVGGRFSLASDGGSGTRLRTMLPVGAA
ncbi:MAG: hypothetical protein U0869_02600 [Chloroflexota bacterium]